MRMSTFLLPAIAFILAPAQGQPAAATSPTSFQTVELRGGGLVTVRSGPERRVTVRAGGSDRPIRSDGEALVIDRCSRPCAHGHRIEVEIVTPEIARLAVTDGGTIQLLGEFPSQAAIAASVTDGGGAVVRGAAADLGRPLAQLDRPLSSAAVVPPVPPAPVRTH